MFLLESPLMCLLIPLFMFSTNHGNDYVQGDKQTTESFQQFTDTVFSPKGDYSGAIITVQTVKKEFKRGELIFLTFSINNTSDDGIRVFHYEKSNAILAKAKIIYQQSHEGKTWLEEIPKTRAGRALRYTLVPEFPRPNPDRRFIIPSKETAAISQPIPVNLYFDMTETGKYQITIHDFFPLPNMENRSVNDSMSSNVLPKLTSNTLEIEVLDEVYSPDETDVK